MKERQEFFDWCIKTHSDHNHFYAGYLPYQFHLEMVIKVANDYKTVWDNISPKINNIPFFAAECACAAHDMLENIPELSYNNINSKCSLCFPFFTSKIIAEMVFAVTDDKGRNRKERHSERFWEGLKTTPGAVFVKLCDRIANVRFGILVGSDMVKMYKKEYAEFVEKLYDEDYMVMFDELNLLFNKI